MHIKNHSNCPIHGDYDLVKTRNHTVDAYAPAYIYKDNGCPKCSPEEAEQAVMESRLKDFMKDPLSYGVTKRFIDCDFLSYKVNEKSKKVFDICKEYAEDKNKYKTGRALVITGSVGTGKTHIGVSILKHEYVNNKDISIKMTTVIKMIREIRSTYGTRANAQDVIDYYARIDLLLIDELGVQLGTESEKMLLFEVINGRYENMKPTILISNLNLIDLKGYVGERAMDRLKDNNGKVAAFTWESYRG